jgi:hypothetical protein
MKEISIVLPDLAESKPLDLAKIDVLHGGSV